MLPIEGELLIAFRCIAEQLRFFGDHGDVVVVGILHSKGEETLELMGTVACKGDVICLTNTGHVNRSKIDAKLGLLSQEQFGIVGKFVQSVAQNSSLFDTEQVVNRTHHTFVPLNKCLTVFQSIIEKNQTLTLTAGQESCSYTDFPQYFVECAFGVKEEKENWFLLNKERVLYHFRDEQRS